MTKFILRMIFIISLSMNIAFAIHMFSHNHDHFEENTFDLYLTEQQKVQLNKIRQKSHQKNELLKTKIAEWQEEMIVALQSAYVDKDKINHCIEKISSIQKEIQQNTIDEIIQLKKQLNPHQCNCLFEGLHTQMRQGSKPCTMECCKPKSKGVD